jgi:hypothetical protein
MANGNHPKFNLIGKRARPENFSGMPLKRLMTEMFEEDLKKCSAATAVGLPEHINHVTLFEFYLNRKWDIYILENIFFPNKREYADR